MSEDILECADPAALWMPPPDVTRCSLRNAHVIQSGAGSPHSKELTLPLDRSVLQSPLLKCRGM